MRKFKQISKFLKEFHFYNKKELAYAASSFSNRQFLLFAGLILVVVISLVGIVGKINNMFLVDIPSNGGELTEGILGSPTLVNPILAFSYADKDLTSLIYSGLMRKTPEGDLIPDLALEYPTISGDGTVYTFKLKEDLRFHDGNKITVDDIIFTIEKIKDPLVKSPHKTNWDGVTITKIDEATIEFKLHQPYISFIDNTTIGILPSHLWKKVNVNEFNLNLLNSKPVGSGPFKIRSVLKNKDGVAEKYELVRFNNFALGKPLIKKIKIISYASEKELIKALQGGSIDQAGGISPENASSVDKNGYKLNTVTLPRVFGIFFNSNKNKIFADPEIVKILNKALDRQEIIDKVLNGYGEIIDTPIPKKILPSVVDNKFTSTTIEELNESLDKLGWKLGDDGIRIKGGSTTTTVTKKVNGKTVRQTVKTNTPEVRLAFALTTGDAPEFKQAVAVIKEQLLKIGVEVDTRKVFETGQINQIIHARDYDALFFGQMISYESDLYYYWHSSNKNGPGLNIGMYDNKKVNSTLESVQKILTREDRLSKYEVLNEEFKNDIPALMIYSPLYLYATSNRLVNLNLSNITIPSDRFSSVYLWSADTDKVYKIFIRK
jgi:peptide/nickel transport system substrate-binding protein